MPLENAVVSFPQMFIENNVVARGSGDDAGGVVRALESLL